MPLLCASPAVGDTAKAATTAHGIQTKAIILVVKALKVIAFTARKGHQICSGQAY